MVPAAKIMSPATGERAPPALPVIVNTAPTLEAIAVHVATPAAFDVSTYSTLPTESYKSWPTVKPVSAVVGALWKVIGIKSNDVSGCGVPYKLFAWDRRRLAMAFL